MNSGVKTFAFKTGLPELLAKMDSMAKDRDILKFSLGGGGGGGWNASFFRKNGCKVK